MGLQQEQYHLAITATLLSCIATFSYCLYIILTTGINTLLLAVSGVILALGAYGTSKCISAYNIEKQDIIRTQLKGLKFLYTTFHITLFMPFVFSVYLSSRIEGVALTLLISAITVFLIGHVYEIKDETI